MGSGLMPGKCGIHLAANLDVIDSVFGEDAFQHAAAGAIHHVDGKLEASSPDGWEVDKVGDGSDVGRLEIG